MNEDIYKEQLPRITKYISRIFVQAFEMPFNELPLYLHDPDFSSESYQMVFKYRLEHGK